MGYNLMQRMQSINRQSDQEKIKPDIDNTAKITANSMLGAINRAGAIEINNMQNAAAIAQQESISGDEFQKRYEMSVGKVDATIAFLTHPGEAYRMHTAIPKIAKEVDRKQLMEIVEKEQTKNEMYRKNTLKKMRTLQRYVDDFGQYKIKHKDLMEEVSDYGAYNYMFEFESQALLEETEIYLNNRLPKAAKDEQITDDYIDNMKESFIETRDFSVDGISNYLSQMQLTGASSKTIEQNAISALSVVGDNKTINEVISRFDGSNPKYGKIEFNDKQKKYIYASSARSTAIAKNIETNKRDNVYQLIKKTFHRYGKPSLAKIVWDDERDEVLDNFLTEHDIVRTPAAKIFELAGEVDDLYIKNQLKEIAKFQIDDFNKDFLRAAEARDIPVDKRPVFIPTEVNGDSLYKLASTLSTRMQFFKEIRDNIFEGQPEMNNMFTAAELEQLKSLYGRSSYTDKFKLAETIRNIMSSPENDSVYPLNYDRAIGSYLGDKNLDSFLRWKTWFPDEGNEYFMQRQLAIETKPSYYKKAYNNAQYILKKKINDGAYQTVNDDLLRDIGNIVASTMFEDSYFTTSNIEDLREHDIENIVNIESNGDWRNKGVSRSAFVTRSKKDAKNLYSHMHYVRVKDPFNPSEEYTLYDLFTMYPGNIINDDLKSFSFQLAQNEDDFLGANNMRYVTYSNGEPLSLTTDSMPSSRFSFGSLFS